MAGIIPSTEKNEPCKQEKMLVSMCVLDICSVSHHCHLKHIVSINVEVDSGFYHPLHKFVIYAYDLHGF